MKQFLALVRKEFYHISRDVRTMVILLIMPLIQIILFGFAITTEVKNVRTAVLDPSKDASTQRIIQQLDNSEYFQINKILNNEKEIEQAFKEGDTDLVVVFSDRFEEGLYHSAESSIQLIADGTDPNQATLLTSYATNIIVDYQKELIRGQKLPFQIKTEIKMLYNPQIKSAYNFVPGVMGMILMIICAMMTSIAIVREKETGTIEVLLASPIKPIYIIISKTVPYFSLSVINLITILLLSVFVLKVPVSGSLFWLVFVSFLFILVALSLGLVISVLVSTQLAAMLFSAMGLLIPVMLLSGMIFPIESMPLVLQWVSNIIPAKWYIMAVRKLMIQGAPIHSALKEISILSAMLIGLISFCFMKFKIRLQ